VRKEFRGNEVINKTQNERKALVSENNYNLNRQLNITYPRFFF